MGCTDSCSCDNDESVHSTSDAGLKGKLDRKKARPKPSRKLDNVAQVDKPVSGHGTPKAQNIPRELEVKLNSGKRIQQLEQPITVYYRILPGNSKGSAGRVYLAEHMITGQECVIKVIKKIANIDRGGPNIDKFSAEVDILSKMDHPNIVKIYEVLEDDKNIYVVSEALRGGELIDYLTSHNFSEVMASKVMQQVFSALSYCHSFGLTHRHLKLENVLLRELPSDDNVFIKVTGFSGAAMLSSNTEMRRIVGSPYTIAPEVLRGRYDEKADIWSCGVMLYMLLCGEPPFQGKGCTEILEKVKRGEFYFPVQTWEGVSEEAKTFISSLLQKNPSDRPSAAECLQSSWILSFKNKSAGLSKPVRNSLLNLRSFHASEVLKQAIYAFIVSRVLAKEETATLSECFTTLDQNGDGQLSPEELLTALKKTMPTDKAIEEAERVMKMVDVDGNGVIDYSEFMIASVKEDNLLSDKNLTLAFRTLDRDNSEKISLDELKAVLRISTGKDTEGSWRKLMEELGIRSRDIDRYQFAMLMRTAVTRNS